MLSRAGGLEFCEVWRDGLRCRDLWSGLWQNSSPDIMWGQVANVMGFSDEVNVGPCFLALRKGFKESEYICQKWARPWVLECVRGGLES